jgi:class 3 adenylate cyclase
MYPASRRRIAIEVLILSLLMAVACGAAIHWLKPLRNVERWTSDVRMTIFSPPVEQHEEIVILTIDEALLATFPYRSPIRRQFLVELLRALQAADIRALGIDLLFDQPTLADEDVALRQAFLDFQAPLIVATGDRSTGLSEEQWRFQAGFLKDIATGSASVLKDEDGVVRQLLAAEAPGSGTQPGLPVALAGALGVRIPEAPARLAYMGLLDGKPPLRIFRAELAASGLLPAKWLTGKVVLLGADLPQQDRHRTPFSLMAGSNVTTPGVVIHAHAVAQLLDGRRLAAPSTWWNIVLLAGLVLAGALLAWFEIPLWLKAPLAFLPLVGLMYLGVALYRSSGLMIPMMLPGLGYAASFVASAVYVGRHQRAAARYIRHAFAHYLSPRVIRDLIRQPEKLRLGGDRREMSLLFSDIAGFTTLSEELSAQALVELLQEYLDNMVEIALRHDGTIDKFIGDAVVVLFGAPAEQPDHAARAIRCAMEMDAFSERYRAEQSERGISLGVTRIGVHTGVATVGNFGGRRRFDYTAMGDTVNTAARLESVNKYFGTRVCISEQAAEGSAQGSLRPIGTLVLKGKAEGIKAFTPVDERSDPELLSGYGSAFAALDLQGEDPGPRFEALVHQYPDDPLIRFHRERLRRGESGVRIVMAGK